MFLLVPTLALIAAQTLSSPPDGGSPADDASRAAAAAEQAAAAAQSAAESAAKAADAAAKLAGLVRPEAAVSPPTVPPPETKGPPPWAGTISASVIWLSGNANTLTFASTANVTRTFSEGWSVTGKAYGTYGQAQAPGATTSSVNALAAGGQLRGDKILVPETSVYVLGGLDTDHVASLELREYVEAGTGIFWLNEKQGDLQKLLLRTDVGFRYAVDDRWEYYLSGPPGTPGDPGLGPQPNITFLGPHFGLAFRYALNKDAIFTEDASIQENIDGLSRTQASTLTKLSTRLVKSLSFAVSFLAAYDSMPALGKVTTDTALTIGLEASF